VKAVADQVVVVVGASSGIGRAAAAGFAAAGAGVVCASRSALALEALVAEITAAGGRAVAVPTDITDPAALHRLGEAAVARFGRVDTWVNVAAVSVYGTVEQVTDGEFRRVLEVNFLGHVSATRVALPLLRAAGGGVLIGVASVEGVRAVPLHGPYSASKFALRAFYDALRMEQAADGAPVAVCTILPASVGTPFFEHSRSKLGVMAKPPPPVYAPDLVARTIVRAATHPRREIPVGGAAVGFLLGQRLSPALTDVVLSLIGSRVQRSDRPDNQTDILDTPTPGPGQVEGDHADRLIRRDLYTTLAGRFLRPGELLLRVRAALAH